MKGLCSGDHGRATIQMKAIEQYFHMVLFVMLYKVVQTFKSVDETLVCTLLAVCFSLEIQKGNAVNWG